MGKDIISDDIPNQEVVPPEDQTVKFSTYQKVLGQRKADQSKFKDLQDAHNVLVAEKQASEEAAKVEQGKFQELFEAEQQKSLDLQTEMGLRVQQDIVRSKEKALRSELSGLRKEEYLKFADIKAIVMDDNGVVDIDSVKQVASSFRASYSDLLMSNQSLPNNAPSPGVGKLTFNEWSQLSVTDKKARSHEVGD